MNYHQKQESLINFDKQGPMLKTLQAIFSCLEAGSRDTVLFCTWGVSATRFDPHWQQKSAVVVG